MKLSQSLRRRYAKSVARLIAGIALCSVATTASAAIFNVVDKQGVIYDIVPGTTNHVIVSSDNTYMQEDLVANIVIPEQVTDISSYQPEGSPEFYIVDGIAPYAFNNCWSLRSVTIEAPVTEIPTNAFYFCRQLTSVTLPSTVRTLGNSAFSECNVLSSLSMPEEITAIGDSCFYNTRFTEVKLPNITRIPKFAFASNTALVTADFSSTSDGEDAEPIQDALLTVDTRAFSGCSALKTINLGNSLQSIGDYAFYSCKKLTFPTIPETCTYWGKYSFANCNDTSTGAVGFKVVIPAQVSMGGYNFFGSRISTITWPETAIDLGEGKTFQKITGITKVTAPAWMEEFTDIYANSTSITICTLPIGVKVVKTGAFAGMTALTQISFPNGFQRIETSGVSGCTGLKTIYFVAGMSVASGAFANATALTGVSFPTEPMGEIEPYPFSGFDPWVNSYQKTMTGVTIPGWMKHIPDGLFCHFWALTNITLQEGIETIGKHAFDGNNATYIKVPSTVTEVGNYAFNDNKAKGIYFTTATAYTPQIKKIGNCAFKQYTSNCTALTLPESLKEIGEYAFSKTSVATITIPAGVEVWDKAFINCTSTKTIVVSDGITKIANNAFEGCKAVTSVTLPSSVTEIGKAAFKNCAALPYTGIPFPENLKCVGDSALAGCSSWYTSSTGYYPLPGGIKYGKNAFNGANIQGLRFPKEKCEFDEGSLSYSQIWRFVSTGLDDEGNEVDKFNTLPLWMDTVPNRMFINNPFTNLVMGGNLKHVGDYAFAFENPLQYSNSFYGHSRQYTTLPSAPCTWGHDVFRNTALYFIDFPDWMTVVPEGFCSADPNTFVENPNKPAGEKYIVPRLTWNNIEKIEPRAFMWMMIADFNLSPKIKEIGDSAFMNAYVCWDKPIYDDQKEENPGWEKTFILTLGNPGGVKIGKDAFTEATISEIQFAGCDEISDEGVFRGIERLEKVTLANCMREIPDHLFESCKNLKTVVLPADGLTYIGDQAFFKCEKLEAFPFTQSLKYIGKQAFAGCDRFDTITWPEEKIDFIDEEAFCNTHEFFDNSIGMRGVKELHIPAWMDNVPSFNKFTSLEKVVWDDRSARTDCDSITGISFRHCTSLKEFNFPDDIEIRITRPSAFRLCTALETVSGGKMITTIPEGCFYGCSSLTSIPDFNEIPCIPTHCFFYTSSLSTVNIGPKVKYIGTGAFYEADIHQITPEMAVKHIVIPETCDSIAPGAFEFSNLDNIYYPGERINYIPYGCFANSSVKEIVIGEGVKDIRERAFIQCQKLSYLELPSTIRLIPKEGLSGTYGLETCLCKSDTLTIGEKAFGGSGIQKFICKGVVDTIGYYAFDGASKLAELEIPYPDQVRFVGSRAFAYSKIKHFPYFRHANLCTYAFTECYELMDMVYPEDGRFLERMIENGVGTSNKNDVTYLAGINSQNSKLQSITFPDDDHFFHFNYGSNGNIPLDTYGGSNNYSSSPLTALSYINDTQLIPYDEDHPEKPFTLWDFGNYSYFSNHSYWDNEKMESVEYVSPLIVRRNEKWKFHQTHYDRFWTIWEKKEPELVNLSGCIYSHYDPKLNVNHYQTNFMWDLALSDLDTKNPTKYTVYRSDLREDKAVAFVEFTVPELLTVEQQAADPEMKVKFDFPVYAVEATVTYPDGTKANDNEYYGNFDIPVENEMGDTIYQVVMGMQWNKIYYNANTSKRAATFDKYGYYPWFVLVDCFDSENLSSGNVPRFYRYRIEMEGYEYQLPVNNAGCELDETTGLRYHYVDTIIGKIVSKSIDLYPTMAMPSLSFKGLYSEEDIRNDRSLDPDLALPLTTNNYVEEFNISYKVDPKVAAMKARRNASSADTEPMIKGVNVYEIRTNEDGTEEHVSVLPEGTPKEGVPLDGLSEMIATLKDGCKLTPDSRYYTVTYSDFRGEYGSPVMSVPGLLELAAEISTPTFTNHNHGGYTQYAQVRLTPTVDKMGYDDAKLASTDYYIGLWRHYNPQGSTLSMAPMREDSWTDGVLIHHSGEDVTDVECGECTPGLVHNEDGTMTYHDYFNVELDTPYDLAYTARAYVKVPESVVPGEPRYMLAQASPAASGLLLSGVEEVTVDPNSLAADGDETWYDLHGIRVDNPIPGNLYIRVTPAGNSLQRR